MLGFFFFKLVMRLCPRYLFLPPVSVSARAESANATVQEAEVVIALCSQTSQQV